MAIETKLDVKVANQIFFKSRFLYEGNSLISKFHMPL